MKNGKVLSRLATNPRVANLEVNEADGNITVSLKAGFINNGNSTATVGNAHAARLFIRDAVGPDGRTARPGRPPRVPAQAIELPAGFVTRNADKGIGVVVKSNAKKATVAANGSQLAKILKLAQAEATGDNIGLRGAGKSVLATVEPLVA